MQTFLPYPDFVYSASCLDTKRLGKQRVECSQLIAALEGKTEGWRNHPACKMWEGHIPSLKRYMNACVDEWVRRGYKNSYELWTPHNTTSSIAMFNDPYWVGNKEFHAAHRSNLLRKDLIHYGQFGWKERSDLPYIWPESPLTFLTRSTDAIK